MKQQPVGLKVMVHGTVPTGELFRLSFGRASVMHGPPSQHALMSAPAVIAQARAYPPLLRLSARPRWPCWERSASRPHPRCVIFTPAPLQPAHVLLRRRRRVQLIRIRVLGGARCAVSPGAGVPCQPEGCRKLAANCYWRATNTPRRCGGVPADPPSLISCAVHIMLLPRVLRIRSSISVQCGAAGSRGVCVHVRAVRGHAVGRHGPGHLHHGHGRRCQAHRLQPGAQRLRLLDAVLAAAQR